MRQLVNLTWREQSSAVTYWLHISEESVVHFVHSNIVFHICQEDIDFDRIL